MRAEEPGLIGRLAVNKAIVAVAVEELLGARGVRLEQARLCRPNSDQVTQAICLPASGPTD